MKQGNNMNKLQTIATLTVTTLTLLTSTANAFDTTLTGGTEPLTQWNKVLEQQPIVAPATGDKVSVATIDTLNQLIQATKGYRYVLDKHLYYVDDYYATPTEFDRYKRGDCEDYAIKWYYMLREQGVPADNINIVSVFLTNVNMYHAVLVVKTDKGNMVVDSIDNSIVDADTYFNRGSVIAVQRYNEKGYTSAF